MSTRVNEDRVRQWWSLRTTSVVRGQFVFFIRLTFRRDTTFQVPFHLESGGFVCHLVSRNPSRFLELNWPFDFDSFLMLGISFQKEKPDLHQKSKSGIKYMTLPQSSGPPYLLLFPRKNCEGEYQDRNSLQSKAHSIIVRVTNKKAWSLLLIRPWGGDRVFYQYSGRFNRYPIPPATPFT